MSEDLPFQVPFIRWAQVMTVPATWQWGARRLYDHELVYVKSGILHMKVGTCSFAAGHDEAFLVPPREEHYFQCSKNQESTFIGVHFDWEKRGDDLTTFRPAAEPVEESLFREPRGVPHWDYQKNPLLDLRGRPHVLRFLHEVVTACSSGGKYSLEMAGCLMGAAIAQMSHEAILLEEVESNPRLGADAVRRVHRARELLEAPRDNPISVQEVAEAVDWSADHLGRMCREILGVSPYRIQTRSRMRRAVEMLRYGSTSIGEVAFRCGYTDPSNFAEAFKRETGLTPRQFLKVETER